MLTGLLHNIGLLALLSVLFSMMRPSRYLRIGSLGTQILIGIIFGAAAAFVMFNPIVIPQGATFDTRGGPAMLVAIYGGPFSTIIAIIIGAFARLQVGGGSAIGGAASFVFYGVAGIVAFKYLNRSKVRPDWKFFLLLSVFGTVCVLPAFFIGQSFDVGISILQKAWWILLVGNIAGVVVLGFMLEVDVRRSQESETLKNHKNLNDGILNAQPAHIAVVDSSGKIQHVNEAWHRFYEENGGGRKNWEGEQYITHSIMVDNDTDGDKLSENIRKICIGELAQYDFLYPCHSPSEKRWFLLMARPINFIGVASALISHVNVTAEHQAYQEMEKAKEEAEKASQAKSEFLSAMSHELRTPMNAILGFTQMLELNPAEPLTENQKQCVEYALKSGRHLLHLIDEVLDLSEFDQKMQKLVLDHILTRQVIDDCLLQMQIEARDKGVEIVDETRGATLPAVWTNELRIKQVLLNLLSNAVKYNHADGKVTLSCREQPDQMLRLSVNDTGDGIPIAKQGDMFVPFNRLGREAGPIAGTGIGLTLSKQIVEALGGKIAFESQEGKGSTFWIDIPMSEQRASGQAH